MPTLAEYAKLSNDVLQVGVYENIITEDQLMPLLQFQTIEGNSLLYNRENALPTAVTFQVGSTLEDTEATYTQNSETLKMIAVQDAMDQYIAQTRGNIQSQVAVKHAGMAKALARKLAYLFVKGDSAVTSTEFNGLDKICRSETRMMAMDDGVVDGPGTAETELTLDRTDAFIDLIEKGKPDALVMNKTMRRKLTALSRATGSGVVTNELNDFGMQVSRYDGIPIIINDHITNSETYADASTWPTSTATTLFAVKFGEEKQGFTVIHNGDVLNVDMQDLGIKENKNERGYRLVVYVGTVLYSAKMIAALGGIDSAA